MTTKTRKTEEQMFDLRILEHKLRRRELDPVEYEAFLKNLSDDESRGEYMEVFEEPKEELDEGLTFTSA